MFHTCCVNILKKKTSFLDMKYVFNSLVIVITIFRFFTIFFYGFSWFLILSHTRTVYGMVNYWGIRKMTWTKQNTNWIHCVVCWKPIFCDNPITLFFYMNHPKNDTSRCKTALSTDLIYKNQKSINIIIAKTDFDVGLLLLRRDDAI